MNTVPVERPQSLLSHVKLFFALSRTPHGVLDMATPALAALLWLGSIPSLGVALLGVMTAFAGYTAVYAINDLVDYRVDKLKLERGGFRDTGDYLDAILVRHPMAYGLLSFKEAVLWTIGWSSVALVGAALLNPFCVVIFVAACLLETVYCLMWKTSYLRTLVSGAVKTSGPVAAVYAVDPNPDLSFLLLLFLWLFCWEIGGQNIPADWTDIEEDRSLHARTIPVSFGPATAAVIVMISLAIAVGLSGLILGLPRGPVELVWSFFLPAAGVYLLLLPAYQLYVTKDRREAAQLFNRASYYPLAILILVAAKVLS
ncbi:MAG TPA: UbiA family prenyltransferase [Syntrophorhabdaceae bacterium]